MDDLVCIDLDNTLADYTSGLRGYIRENGHGEDEFPCPDPTDYDMSLTAGWPFTGSRDDYRWWHTRAVADHLYSRLEPYGHAVDALHDLKADGWRILIMTGRRDDRRGETLRWLHANGIPFDGLYMGDKTILQADVYVDDDPAVIRRLTARGRIVIHPWHAYCRNASPWTFDDWSMLPGLADGER